MQRHSVGDGSRSECVRSDQEQVAEGDSVGQSGDWQVVVAVAVLAVLDAP